MSPSRPKPATATSNRPQAQLERPPPSTVQRFTKARPQTAAPFSSKAAISEQRHVHLAPVHPKAFRRHLPQVALSCPASSPLPAPAITWPKPSTPARISIDYGVMGKPTTSASSPATSAGTTWVPGRPLPGSSKAIPTTTSLWSTMTTKSPFKNPSSWAPNAASSPATAASSPP